MNFSRLTISTVILLSFFKLSAQDKELQISAELRPRVIVDEGYGTPKAKGESAPIYTTQRTRLNAMFVNDKFETYISIQDVRLWGADDNYKSSGVYGNTESLSLHQAWVKLKITEAFSLKIGKQIFSYDDQRIISSRNWNDYQVTYDALLAEWKTEKHRLHLGLTYNAESKTDILISNEKFKTFDFAHYQYQQDKFSLSCIAVLTGNTLTDTTDHVYYRGTYGANANYKTDKTKARLTAYYQHNYNDIGGKVSAFCFSVNADREVIKKLRLGLGYDYLSGNDEASTSDTDNNFDKLYGRRHSYYGYIDFFSNTPEQGLQDFMINTNYKPGKNLNIFVDWHYFKLGANKYDNAEPTIKLSRKLGHELDIKVKWKFHEMAELESGYSIYGMTNTLKQLKEVESEDLKTPQFWYVMITLKPSFWF